MVRDGARRRLAGAIRQLILGACGAATVAATAMAAPPAPAQDPLLVQARAALPQSVRQSGVLKVAGAFVWAPFDWVDHGVVKGMEIDLITILARKLGLRPVFSDIKFASLMLSIQNERFDVALGQIGITEKRKKVLMFVPNFRGAFGLLVRRGKTGVDINNLCGRTLAATVGSGQLPIIQDLSDACVQAGRPPIALQVYGDPLNTYLAISNGRGDAYMVTKAPGIYIARRNPRLEVAPGTLAGASQLSGFAVSRKRPALQRALALALESARRDGSYMVALRRYGIESGALMR